MAQQLIYTSARRLLQAGQSGFGTVARSKSLTGLTVGSIERLSQFASLRGYDRSRVIFAHRRITVGNNRFHLLSSIRDAGSDYTSRTNHIAHHLVVAPNEAARLGAAGINPADVMTGFDWLQSWDGAPKLYGPEEDIDLMGMGSGREAGSRRAWEAATGNGLHARLLADPETPRTGVLAIPDGVEPLPLLAEAIAEKDAQRWDVTFTTCLEQGDELSDFDWIMCPAALLGSVQSRCGSRTFLRVDQPGSLKVPAERERKIPVPTAVSPQSSAVVPEPTLPTPEPHSAPQASLVTAESARDSGPSRPGLGDLERGRGQPNRIVIILSAVAAMAALLLVAVLLLNGGDGEKEGKSARKDSAKEAKPGSGQPPGDPLVGRLRDMGIDSNTATDIAGQFSKKEEKDQWDQYLLWIKDHPKNPEKNDWEKLEKIPPKGKLPSDSELVSLIDEKKGLPRIAELAVSDPWKAEHWRDFDACVRHLLDGNGGVIFKPSEGAKRKPWVDRWRDEALPGLAKKRLEQLKEAPEKGPPGLVKEVKGLSLWRRDEFKREGVIKLLADLSVPSAVAKNEPTEPAPTEPAPTKPKETKPEPPKEPRVIRRIVERENLVEGIPSTLFEELLRKGPDEKGDLFLYKAFGAVSLDGDEKDKENWFLTADSKDGPYEAKLGNIAFFTVKKGGTIKWSEAGDSGGRRRNHVNRIMIEKGGDKEEILVYPRKSSDEQFESLWGEHPFEVEAKGRNVLIKGELAKQLQNLKGSRSLQVRLKDPSKTSKDLRKEGEEWLILEVIPMPKAIKLEPKWEEYEVEEKGEKVKKKRDVARKHLQEKLGECRGYLEKQKGDMKAEDHEKMQKPWAEKLFKAVKEVSTREMQKDHWKDLFENDKGKDPGYSPTLIKYAEDLLKRSNLAAAQKRNVKKREDRLNVIRRGLEVWTKGLNDGQKHLLFEGITP
ncbi:MAG: hypothetical protein CMN03_04425 [Roseibacillus sp.]|nr:hypothetical protein [Roseibacillus sp.]